MKKLIFTSIVFVSIILTGAIIGGEKSKIDMNRAEKLYKDHCSKCHRNNGKGIKNIYPPLKNADYIKDNSKEELLRGMLFGRSGVIVVNNKKYNGVMTTEIDKDLTDSDVALILAYIYKKYNKMEVEVTLKDVQSARKKGKLPEHGK